MTCFAVLQVQCISSCNIFSSGYPCVKVHNRFFFNLQIIARNNDNKRTNIEQKSLPSSYFVTSVTYLRKMIRFTCRRAYIKHITYIYI